MPSNEFFENQITCICVATHAENRHLNWQQYSPTKFSNPGGSFKPPYNSLGLDIMYILKIYVSLLYLLGIKVIEIAFCQMMGFFGYIKAVLYAVWTEFVFLDDEGVSVWAHQLGW